MHVSLHKEIIFMTHITMNRKNICSMFKNRLIICLTAMMSGLCATAQNAYPEEDDENYGSWTYEVTFSGQRPTIVDFVNGYLAEPEDELSGALYEAFEKYKANKPLDKGTKVTVDVKNGFVCFEFSRFNEEGKLESKSTTEMCYWNSSDGKHKVFAASTYTFLDGKAMSGGQFDGLNFCVYNNDTHHMKSLRADDMGAEVEMENTISYEQESGNYYVKNLKTGEKKKITEDEYSDGLMHEPTVVYSLPQSGKNITATIHNLPQGERKVQLVWNGLRFKQE